MAEPFISKRVIFPRGRQRAFICGIQESLDLPLFEMSRILKISNKTLADWRHEKFSMSLEAFKVLLKRSKMEAPKDIKIRDAYWYARKGARAGGIAVYKKYGRVCEPAYRKMKWREWWERKGKHQTKYIIWKPKPIKKPKFSKELAEFTGIMLGDGGVSQYQIYITLHLKDDKEYSDFVSRMIKRLFNVPVHVFGRKDDSTIRLVVSRRGLVDFCRERIGLKIGNKIKQQVDIPSWIKQNKRYSVACLRGLMDTDGCLFDHKYKVGGRLYKYKKLSFTSYSRPLRQSVFDILENNGFRPRLAQKNDVRLDRAEDVKRYFRLIVPHNYKYLKKYQN
jgi:hypothetical protein